MFFWNNQTGTELQMKTVELLQHAGIMAHVVIVLLLLSLNVHPRLSTKSFSDFNKI